MFFIFLFFKSKILFKGDEGAETVAEFMAAMGKTDALMPMEDNEEPDSGDEEEEDDDGSENETDSADETDEIDSEDEVKEAEKSVSVVESNSTNNEVSAVQCSITEFCNQPSAARLVGFGNSISDKLIEEVQQRAADGTEESVIYSTFDVLMRISSIATSNNDNV